ncbi:MAG: FtsQ-type POTRA domain-containing protein [Balneolaceae bacterium]
MSENTSHIKSTNRSQLPIITAILMASGLAMLAAIYWNKNVTVEHVQFSGNYFTETEQLEAAAVVPFGISPDSIDVQAIRQRIEALPYVKIATPYIEPNGNLNISITEREPLAMLVQADNRVYVDEEGVRLPIVNGKIRNVPLVYGFNATATKDTLNNTEFIQIRDLLVSARTNQFGWATISEVAYNGEEGVIALSQENGVKLVFGENDFDIKFENWETFYAEIVRVKGINKIQQVDLRFLNQVVTRES